MDLFRLKERSMCQRDAGRGVVEIHSVTAEKEECADSEGAIAFNVFKSLLGEPP
jgi:hypothetical protein